MSKTTRLTIVLFSLAILILTFTIGYKLGSQPSNASSTEGLATVERAWNIIFEDYVDNAKLDSAKLSRGAIEGMIKVLDDPYTSYLSPEDYKLSLSNLQGEFEGIGAHVGVRNNQVTIIAPIPGSPAEAAGIKPGDVILAVNGDSTENLTLEEVVLRIRGQSGTSVNLLVRHEGAAEPVQINIVRAKVKVSSVSTEMKEDMAYININQFAENTDAELTAVLEDIVQKGAKGIILDLRQNPGGLLNTVIDVASHFIREGVVARVVGKEAQNATYEVQAGRFFTDLPMVVLVDEFSASGSEVLSGALKDHGRAVVAGSKTYGKGSVNILRQLDGSGLYITTARWLTPNGSLIEGKGIQPDYELKDDQDAIQWAIDYLHGKIS